MYILTGTYVTRGPNDEQQADNLDIGYVFKLEAICDQIADILTNSHHIFTLLLDGKLFLAPIHEKPQRALDVGTGTGIWAMYTHTSSNCSSQYQAKTTQ